MKKILLLIALMGHLFGWETTTHRAIDKTAIESKSVVNLTNFVKSAGIEEEKYYSEIFEGYTNKETGKPITYFDYFNDDLSSDAMAKWGQEFNPNNPSYQNLIEAGTMLEDAQWSELPLWGANGRFLNHFADPQNNYKGFVLGKTNALLWATFHNSNKYNYQYALDYFTKGFTSESEKERTKFQAKMFVSVGHIMHLMNDMNVPAHTRNDAHPNGDALEWWARGGESGSLILFIKRDVV